MTRNPPTVRNTHLRYVRELKKSGDLWATERDVVIKEGVAIPSGSYHWYTALAGMWGPSVADYDDLETVDVLP